MICRKCQEPFNGRSDCRARISIFAIGHECVYSYWRCRSCGWYTIDAYEDRWDGKDPVTYLGPVPFDVGDRCLDLIRACPDPMDQNCECESHGALFFGTPR